VNTATTGALCETKVILEYQSRGYTISLPTNQVRYDVVAEKNGRFLRIQVKAGTSFNNGTELLSFTKIPYSTEDADVVVIVDLETDKKYFIPVSHVEGMTSIRLRLEPYKYKTENPKALISEHYTKFIG
jgi:hypothetical protein